MCGSCRSSRLAASRKPKPPDTRQRDVHLSFAILPSPLITQQSNGAFLVVAVRLWAAHRHLLSPHRVLSSSRRYTPLHTNTDSP